MKVAQQLLEIMIAAVAGGGLKGLAQRRSDAHPIVGKIDADQFAVTWRARTVVTGGREDHANTTIGERYGFATPQISSCMRHDFNN